MIKERKLLLYITQAAMIAAIYVVLTIVFAPISFNFMQVRISEILCILPLFTSAAIPGLTVGCVLGNLFGGGVIYDIVFGSLATLLGAYFGYLLRFNRWLVPIPTIVSNAVIIPLVLKYGYMIDEPLYLMSIYIAVGEFISVFILGEILISFLQKRKQVISKEDR